VNRLLVVDSNNLIHIEFHNNKGFDGGKAAVDLAISQFILRLNYLRMNYKPTTIILCFDSLSNWRKKYTKTTAAITNKVYKENRTKKLSKKEKEIKIYLDQKIDELAAALRNNTKLFVLCKDGIECDDFVGGVCQIYGGQPGVELKLVSSDKDYIQLLRHENVEIVNPLKNGKKRSLKDFNNDPDLYIFEKCIRGDSKDNVRSSYPRLQRKKLVEAFYDDYKMQNLMEHEFEETIYDEHKEEYTNVKFKVRDLFEENRLLLDLESQPDEIKEEIFDEIERELCSKKKMSIPYFLRYLGKNDMKNVISSMTRITDTLANKPY